ncbi:MAG: STAS-like domain-containing protein [Deltaproteobacteria bacterium]|nr:STAS-like domain-containing protein [Deltaproteobacteria bacterium]
MKIEIKKFGTILTSRPAGREAALIAKSYLKPKDSGEKMELDFSGVKVMTPSWLDEFLQGLSEAYGDRVVCLPSENVTVMESLKALEEP